MEKKTNIQRLCSPPAGISLATKCNEPMTRACNRPMTRAWCVRLRHGLSSIIVLILCSSCEAMSPVASPDPAAAATSSSTPAPSPSKSPSTAGSSRLSGNFGNLGWVLVSSAAALTQMTNPRHTHSLALLVLLSAALIQVAAAQVSEQETTTKPTGLVPTKPAIDCSVEWSESWTKCSREGKQSRRYRVLVYPTRIGRQCPAPETRACVYPGAQTILVDGNEGLWRTRQCPPTRRLLAYTGETHETFAMPRLCQYDPIKVTVGDVVVFKKSLPSDTITALPSQWHYNECNFTDGGSSLQPDDASTDSELRYTIGPEQRNKRLYVASARDNACSRGQRVLISVDDFKQGTLAEVIYLVENKAYTTEEGAIALIERIWCFEDHCPAPAMGWYEGNAQWAKARYAYSLLGFVYRKRPKPQVRRAEEYYKKALELVPQHCEATSYMGELYLQVESFEQASETYARLQALVASEKTGACEKALEQLGSAWRDKRWCPPPVNTKKPCISSSHALHAARPFAATAVWLASSVVLVTTLLSVF